MAGITHISTGGTNTGTATSASAGISGSPPAGDTLIVVIVADSGGSAPTYTISDDNGNTYTSIGRSVVNGMAVEAWVSTPINGAATVLATVTLSTSSTYAIGAIQYRSTGAILSDGSAHTNNNFGTSLSVTAPSLNHTPEMLIGFMGLNKGVVSGITGSGGPYTSRFNISSGSTAVGFAAEDVVSTSNGTNSSWTNGSNNYSSGVLAALYDSGAAPPTPDDPVNSVPRQTTQRYTPKNAVRQSLYSASGQTASDPQFGQQPAAYSIGVYHASRFNKNAFRYEWESIDQSLTIQAETNPHNRGVYHPPVFNKAAFLGLRQGANNDTTIQFLASQLGQYRVQNLSAEGYLLYVGVNCQPDFSAAASMFSATLPVTLAWPLPGNGTENLYVVPRFRDSYGCISQNSNPWIITLTPGGEVYNPVPLPQNVFGYAVSNGNLAISAAYPTLTIDRRPADKVRVWVGTSPPNVALTPTFEGAVTGTPFTVAFGSYSAGTYYVAVALYRSLDGAVSGPVSVTVVVPEIPDGPQGVFTENITNP